MISIRAEWPHTIDDILKSLDGVWGVVGAKGSDGNLYRIERSLKEPTIYKVVQYKGEDESSIVSTDEFEAEKKSDAVNKFARAIGFEV